MAEMPNNHLGCMKPLENNGKNYQPQLVIAGFLNHQQYEQFLPLGGWLCFFLAGPKTWAAKKVDYS